MSTRRGKSIEDADQFGFRWGPLDVARQAEFKGHYCVAVQTDFGSIDIYVSKTGRSIRAFRNGEELKPIRTSSTERES